MATNSGNQPTLGYQPTKAIAFDVPIVVRNSAGFYGNADDISSVTLNISKDKGAFVAPVNSLAEVTNDGDFSRRSAFYLTLTADEMDADEIVIRGRISGTNIDEQVYIVIKTSSDSEGGGGGSATPTNLSAASLSSMLKGVLNGYSVNQLSFDDGGFNYFGLVSSKLWFIIKESTDYTTVEYHLGRQSKQTFNDGWTNRASINYDPSEPIC